MIRAKFKPVYHRALSQRCPTLGSSAMSPLEQQQSRGFSATAVQKLIRAAHAKEKQLPEELVQPPESP